MRRQHVINHHKLPVIPQLNDCINKSAPIYLKRMRLEMQSDLFSDQKIFLPKAASWLDDYRTELIGFPRAKYSDQADSTSQALECFKNKYSSTLVIWEKLDRWINYILYSKLR